MRRLTRPISNLPFMNHWNDDSFRTHARDGIGHSVKAIGTRFFFLSNFDENLFRSYSIPPPELG